MQEKTYTKTLSVSKLIQLIVTLIIDVAFFLLLILNPDLRNNIFDNRTLTLLCFFIWITMIVFLIFIILDFRLLRTITLESHNLNQAAYLDDLTNIPNRRSLDLLFKTYHSPEMISDMCCCMLTLSNLGDINDKYGRETGDVVLKDFGAMLGKIGDSYGFLGRNSGNEFILLMEHCTPQKYQDFSHTLIENIDTYNATHTSPSIETEIAFTLNSEAHVSTLNQLFATTSSKLYSRRKAQ